MNTLNKRKEELEKEIYDLAKGFYSTSDVYIDNMPELAAELKGINLGLEACEEMLKLKDEWKAKWELEFRKIYKKKLNQALSQRNKEILEIIDKWETKQPIDQKYKMEKKGIFYNIYNVSELNLQELKKQLTAEALNKPLNVGFLIEIKKDSVINEFGFKSLDYKILNKLGVKNE